MKILQYIITTAALLTAVTAASAQTQVGYTTGNMGRTTVKSYGMQRAQGMAIRLSHEKLQSLAGQSITGIYTAFGSANSVADKKANLFVSTSLSQATPVVEQVYTIASANRWYTIQLDTPYVITGEEDELVVGYTLQSKTDDIPEALQFDLTNDQRGCSYVWDGQQWIDVYGMEYGSANLRIVLGGVVDFTDVMLSEVSFADNYYLAGQTYEHTASVFNFGTAPILSMDVTIKMDEAEQTVTYSDLNIAQNGTYQIALPQLTAAQSGTTSVEVSVKTNDRDDADFADNHFASSAFFYPADMERNIFVEEFTGMTCPNCPAGARTLLTAIEQCGLPCVEVMHHAGYSADFYSVDADYDYTWYYGSSSTYAPAAMVNRITNMELGSVPVFNIGLSSCLSTLQLAATRQPYVSLDLASTYNSATRQVEVSLDVFAHNNLPGATLLNVFLVQDSIIGYQSNGGNEYAHNGVLRQVLTGNSWGLLLPDDFGQGQTQHWDYSFELPDAIYSDFWTSSLLAQASYTADMVTIPTDPAHMRIVAYVANYDPNNIHNNVVHNCIEVPLMNGSDNALEQVGGDCQPGLSFDLSGRRVDAASNLSAGFYIVNGQKLLVR